MIGRLDAEPQAGGAVVASGAPAVSRWVPGALLAAAALGWGWSVLTIRAGQGDAMDGMAKGPGGSALMGLSAFLVAWVAMMAAMMLPAVIPVVRLYGLSAARGAAAPLPFFVAGYLVVWSAIGLPVYLAWRALGDPLARGDARLAGVAAAVLLAAAVYQLTPLKAACLRHCRSPLSFFLRQRGDLRRPETALRMGLSHGLVCLGCCWALMAILVVLGTMQLGAMVVLMALIVAEKTLPRGPLVARATPVALAGIAAALLIHTGLMTYLT